MRRNSSRNSAAFAPRVGVQAGGLPAGGFSLPPNLACHRLRHAPTLLYTPFLLALSQWFVQTQSSKPGKKKTTGRRLLDVPVFRPWRKERERYDRQAHQRPADCHNESKAPSLP